MTSELKLDDTTLTTFFKSELTNGKELRWLGTYENPFFIAKDIAEFLGYDGHEKAVRVHIDIEDKTTFKQLKENGVSKMDTLKIQDQTILINESGLYSLILRSKLEKAKEFKKWVTSVVLPNIRKTGQYKVDLLQKELDTNKKELETTKNNYQTLSIKNNSFMKKHHYIKFKESGPCFYIVDPGVKCECVYNTNRKKFGVAGISSKNEQIDTIDKRLQSHRTTWPLLKVEFILFTKHAVIIEKNFKIMYEKEINPNGHEIIEGISSDVMIEKVKQLLEFLSIKDFNIISGEKLLEYNNYVDTTVKTKYLTKENDKVTEENDKVTEENDKVIEDDKVTKENDKVTEERDKVTEEDVIDYDKYKRLCYMLKNVINKFYMYEYINLQGELASYIRTDKNHPLINITKSYIDELNYFFQKTDKLLMGNELLQLISSLSIYIKDHLSNFLLENNINI